METTEKCPTQKLNTRMDHISILKKNLYPASDSDSYHIIQKTGQPVLCWYQQAKFGGNFCYIKLFFKHWSASANAFGMKNN
jgi:hypothetical protein